MNTIHFAAWDIYVFIIVVVLSWVFQLFKKSFKQKESNSTRPVEVSQANSPKSVQEILHELRAKDSEKEAYLERRADHLVDSHKGDFDAILENIKSKTATPFQAQAKPKPKPKVEAVVLKPKKKSALHFTKNEIKRAYIVGEVLQKKF